MIRTLYGYNRWANARIFDTAAQLSPAQLRAPGNAGRGSIYDTLFHMIGTQRGWLAWWNGSKSPEEAMRDRPDPADYADLASLRALWQRVEDDTQAFVASLSDEEAAHLTTAPRLTMPLWKLMLHVANHATQHRSEIAAMLTGFGHSPGDLDLLFYPGLSD